MKRLSFLLVLVLGCASLASPALAAAAEQPLRIFIRSGPKSHGPGAHDYPRFLREWVPLLNERGAKTTGADAFPTQAQLEQTDVLILHAQEAGNIPAVEDRRNLQAFLQRGGGLVVIHAGIVSADPTWFKGIVGGAWRHGTAKWLEGPMQLYFADRTGPIVGDVSNWSMNDEIYYDLDLDPAAKILATAYTPKPAASDNPRAQQRANELTSGGKRVSVYDIQPQMWTYERTVEGAAKPYRAFVSIPGHLYENFNRPNYRAILLRGIAWAGQRADVDELCRPDELGDALRYVEGGPTHPRKAAAKIEVHPEFALSLVASEPLINKVMTIDWDEKGRLWVAETPEYPNGRRTLKTAPWKDSGSLHPYDTDRDPEDSISHLADTDADGTMDTKKVFADKLELITGFVFYRTGVIAATSPDIWFLEDTDGDGVADRRTKLYTGLGIADTHAVINNLRWGLDGWIYATHGYSRGDVKSPDGTKRFGPDLSGVVRFKPDGSAFEQYNSRGGNTWGLETTWNGQIFWTQPTSGTVFFHTVLPESVLAKGKIPGTTSSKGMIVGQKTYPAMSWPEQAYVQIDQVGRFTAAAGCAIYEGGAWPEKWNYSYFTGEPTLNIVHHQFVKPDGVSYSVSKEKGREETEFIRSTDLWFRPIETRIGPDGALYVIDFYNQAVIHNDTRGPVHGPANAAVRPDRDHYFARLWRVQHKEAKTLTFPALDRKNLDGLLRVIATHPNAHVKKTAWRLAQETAEGLTALANLRKPLGSPAEAKYRTALVANTAAERQALLKDFALATEPWTQTAIVAAATERPGAFLVDTFALPDAKALAPFATAVAATLKSGELTAVLKAAAAAPADALPLKLALLRALALNVDLVPPAEAALAKSLLTLLDDPKTAAAALPLAARWDTTGMLASTQSRVSAALFKTLADATQPDAERNGAGIALVSTPKSQAEALAKIGALLADSNTSAALKTSLISTLGSVPGEAAADALVSTFNRDHAQAVFEQIVKRPESALALLAAVKAGKVPASGFGPGNVARLRTHPNQRVARQAAALLATLSPEIKEKDALIAKLAPEVEKIGDAAKGRVIFTAACATCHSNGEITGREVGPPLAGMGAHGPAELLMHILDPNREVDPSFHQWNLTTKSDETFVGVIVTENAATISLRNQGGDFEIKKDDVVKRENTRRSLMPEGFEGIGTEGLRDLLTYLCGADRAFRVIDLRSAYNADSRRGMFRREDLADEALTLSRFGNVSAAGVPFSVMDPAKSPNGRNVVVLKGGPDRSHFSKEFPQRVEIPASVTASTLYFLGGVGGNAWPVGGDAAKGKSAMKVIVEFADGSKEEHVLQNGDQFTDALDTAEVPGSRHAGNFTRLGQLRTFAVALSKNATLKTIALESFDNEIVPCTVAITASAEAISKSPLPGSTAAAVKALTTPAVNAPANPTSSPNEGPKEGGKGDAPLPPLTPISWEPGKTRVLLIGGGSSHNFGKFFGETDGATLRAAGFGVHYTEDRDQAAAALAEADVAVISVNRRFFDTPAYREALFAFAAAGKGIVMLHPGTWYGFAQWPELNAKIVGGGARGHDKIAPFSVNALRRDHPVMTGVPAAFTVEDELYHINAEPGKIPPSTAPIEVLAETSPSVKFGRPHPAVWVTAHENARIVGITLGHDRRVHDLPAFQSLLSNAVRWTAEKR